MPRAKRPTGDTIDRPEPGIGAALPAETLALVIPDQVPGPVETVNLSAAMAGLSEHTQRAYIRWIGKYLRDVGQAKPGQFSAETVPIGLILGTLGAANLKAWLGRLKVGKLGKQSLGQAKAAIVWLAQLMADMEKSPYDVASGLSRIKMPRAEAGQRKGTWLTVDEVKQLLRMTRTSAHTPAAAARNSAMVSLLVICGLRRDEITHISWGDLQRQGNNRIIGVHGKGSKLRQIKLTASVANAIEAWRPYHPDSDSDSSIMFTRIFKNGRVTTLPITDKTVFDVVRDAAIAAGLGRIAPHDLRRSFARGAFEAGASFELIRQSLGHSNIATTERYVNSALELDQAATDIWADALND
jgi:site-specific recombinase XerD